MSIYILMVLTNISIIHAPPYMSGNSLNLEVRYTKHLSQKIPLHLYCGATEENIKYFCIN